MKERVLVTGATGFVGANLVRRLIRDNYEVHILTRETSNLWRIKEIYSELIDWKVDLKEKETLKKVLKKIKPDYIIHLAIYGGRPYEQDVDEIINSNFLGTVNLIEATRDINYKVFVNTGSSSEYGSKKEKMQENMICEPNTVYGIAKVGATLYCNYEASKNNKNIGTIRLFSPFGDFEDKGRLFPDIILSLLENKNVNLANPEAVRDFIYIEDVIDLYMEIIKKNLNIKGEIFNCGYGQQHSVKYIADKIKKYLNSEKELKYGKVEGRSFDTNTWESDLTKIKDKLLWYPKLDFDYSIEKACEWYKKNINLYK